MSFIIVIPARWESSRLPGKPLEDIHGKPMIAHVIARSRASGADRVIVATDQDEIATIAREVGAEVCMTRKEHESGTERLSEVVENLDIPDKTVIINVQGDEPLIPPAWIQELAKFHHLRESPVATLATPVTSVEEANNLNVVKVVLDCNRNALYFSRAPIPWTRNQTQSSGDNRNTPNPAPMLRHIGLYAYRAGFLREYNRLRPSDLERIESLEQLRILWNGKNIAVSVMEKAEITVSVDTNEDLERVRQLPAKLFDPLHWGQHQSTGPEIEGLSEVN